MTSSLDYSLTALPLDCLSNMVISTFRTLPNVLQLLFAQICHTTPMPYLTRASEAGTLRPWSITTVGFPSAEEHDTDATRLYL